MAVKQYSTSNDGENYLGKEQIFKVKDFQCSDGTDMILMDNDLVLVLEKIYLIFDKMRQNGYPSGYENNENYGISFEIASGYRSDSKANSVGYHGDPHNSGVAADFGIRIVSSPTTYAGVVLYTRRGDLRSHVVYEYSSHEIAAVAQLLNHPYGVLTIESFDHGYDGYPTNIHIDVKKRKCWGYEINGSFAGNINDFYADGIAQGYSDITNFITAIKNGVINPASLKTASDLNISENQLHHRKIARVDFNSENAKKHLGVDIAPDYQYPINWDKAKAAGVDFVLFNVASLVEKLNNTRYLNTSSYEAGINRKHFDDCIKHEIPFGIYFFDYADQDGNESGRMAELCQKGGPVEQFINKLKMNTTTLDDGTVVEWRDWMAFPVYIDYEDEGNGRKTTFCSHNHGNPEAGDEHIEPFLNMEIERYAAGEIATDSEGENFQTGVYAHWSDVATGLGYQNKIYAPEKIWSAQNTRSNFFEVQNISGDGKPRIIQYDVYSSLPGFYTQGNIDHDYAFCEIRIDDESVSSNSSSTDIAKMKEKETAKQHYEQLRRADYNNDGGVTVEDAYLILNKSGKLLPDVDASKNSVFKLYNNIVDLEFKAPIALDEVKEIDGNPNWPPQKIIYQALMSLYADTTLMLDIETAQAEKLQELNSLIETNIESVKSNLGVPLDDIITDTGTYEDVIIDMIIGNIPFDSRLKIFPSAKPTYNGYAVWLYNNGETDFDEQAFREWQERKLKPRFFATRGLQLLRSTIKTFISSHSDGCGYAEIWTNYRQKIEAEYERLGIYHAKDNSLLYEQSAGNDIIDFFSSEDGKLLINIEKVISILHEVFNIVNLSAQDVEALGFEQNHEFTLEDAYTVYLALLALETSFGGGYLYERDAEIITTMYHYNYNPDDEDPYHWICPEQTVQQMQQQLWDGQNKNGNIYLSILVATMGEKVNDFKNTVKDALNALEQPAEAMLNLLKSVTQFSDAKDLQTDINEELEECRSIINNAEPSDNLTSEKLNELEEALNSLKLDLEANIGSFEKVCKILASYLSTEKPWYHPTMDDYYDANRNCSAYLAFRDLVRVVVAFSSEAEQAKAIYEKFFKEEYIRENFFGRFQSKENKKSYIFYLQNNIRQYDFVNTSKDLKPIIDVIKNNDSNSMTVKYFYDISKFEAIKSLSINGYSPITTGDKLELKWASMSVAKDDETFPSEYDEKTDTDTPQKWYCVQEKAPTAEDISDGTTGENDNIITGDESEGIFEKDWVLKIHAGQNAEQEIEIAKMPPNFQRFQEILAREALIRTFQHIITKLEEDIFVVKKLNKKMKEPDFIFGEEFDIAKYYYLLEELGSENDWPDAEANLKRSTWFGSEFTDERQGFQHYDFYKRIKTTPTSLGKFYPLSDKSEKAQIFYFKNGNNYYPLNKIEKNETVDIGNGIVLTQNNTLADILHSNHIYLDRIDDWKFWSRIDGDKTIVSDLTRYNMNDAREVIEWRERQLPFIRRTGEDFGYGTLVDNKIVYDKNQALIAARYMTILYPGLLAYKDENFDIYTGWRKGLSMNPENLVFWIDFLDDQGDISRYSVRNIGQRQKVINQDNVRAIKYIDTEKIVFIAPDDEDLFTDGSKKQKFAATHSGYKYIQLGSGAYNQMAQSSQGIDAYTMIENLLYNYAQCAESVSLSCIPLYFLEPNTRIQIYNPDTDINGIYNLSKISIPLGHAGTMSLNLTKALEDVVTREEIVSV